MFKVTRTPSLLKCETAIFVLDWDPTAYTLQDIQDIIAESVDENMHISVIRKGNSIVVTCFFPLSITIVLIAKAQETLEKMKKKGLIQLTIGYCTIYDKHQRDKVVILHNNYYFCDLLIYIGGRHYCRREHKRVKKQFGTRTNHQEKDDYANVIYCQTK